MDPTNVANGPVLPLDRLRPEPDRQAGHPDGLSADRRHPGRAGRARRRDRGRRGRPVRRPGPDDAGRAPRDRQPAAGPGRGGAAARRLAGRPGPAARRRRRGLRSGRRPPPADSTPATLYDYDPPGALIGPNGDYVFDTFRVIVRASEPLDGTITIRNAAGDTVKTLTARRRLVGVRLGPPRWRRHAHPGRPLQLVVRRDRAVGQQRRRRSRRAGAFDLDATDPATTVGGLGDAPSERLVHDRGEGQADRQGRRSAGCGRRTTASMAARRPATRLRSRSPARATTSSTTGRSTRPATSSGPGRSRSRST